MFKICLLCLLGLADPILLPTANPLVPPACIAPAKQVAEDAVIVAFAPP